MPVLMSTPVRSRIVYAYSALVRRRTVTRPGSPACRASNSPSAVRIQATTEARSASVGKSSASSGGGMSRLSSMSATSSQMSAFSATPSGVIRPVSLSKSMLALARAPVWQSEQYFSKVAAAAGAPVSAADRVRWDAIGAVARGAAGVARSAAAGREAAARSGAVPPVRAPSVRDCAAMTETSAPNRRAQNPSRFIHTPCR